LGKEDQEAFDRLFDPTEIHTSAAVYMSSPWALEVILLSITLEHEKLFGDILGKSKEKKA